MQGPPGDIVDLVAMFCSEDARWSTGLNICANGATF
jgi:hypothetical protein